MVRDKVEAWLSRLVPLGRIPLYDLGSFFLKALISSGSLLIKITMLVLRGLTLGVPSSVHFLKLALSSRAMPLSDKRPSASLIRSLDRGGLSEKRLV